MAKIKSHKTPEQIAKKHSVSMSTIRQQLKIGIPIENEHTKDKDLATDIALQHLDEFPDYYTRLKKMEKSAKKNIKEVREESRYCPLCQKKETRSECSYGEKVWDKVSVKDEEYSMARSELTSIENAVRRLKNTIGKGEGNLEAWVQSKITKASDYIDTVADYLDSGEHGVDEQFKMPDKINPKKHKKSSKVQKLYIKGSNTTNKHEKNAFLSRTGAQLPKINKEERLVDKILKDLQEEDPCWKGYTQVGMKKKNGKEVPNCVPSKGVPKAKGYKKESVTIQDANGNDYVEFVDLIVPDKLQEAKRLQAETGNIISVTLSWRGRYYSIATFFPQTKLPTRREIQDEIQKIYPDSKVISHSVSDIKPGQPLIRVSGSYAKPGPNKNYVKPMGEEREIEPPREKVGALTNIGIPQADRDAARLRTLAKAAAKRKKSKIKKEVEISEAKKSEMPCNKPKAQAVGDSQTGKSHVVKACSDRQEKLIRFGQRGVKGSPKKKGESKEYASRRHRFQTRHAKNIAKGKMSAAYWANKVKW